MNFQFHYQVRITGNIGLEKNGYPHIFVRIERLKKLTSALGFVFFG